jgi:hypothetical protein
MIGARTLMAKNTKKKSKKLRIEIAGPDHPIYSEGWTVGSGRLFSQSTSPFQRKVSEAPASKTPPKDKD